ncbi:MAG: HTH domain-containing protein [Halobellus sp.]
MLSHDTQRRSDPVWSADGADGGGAGGTSGERDPESTEKRVELWRKPVRTGGRNEFELVEDRLRELAECDHVDAVAVKSWDRYVDDAEGRRGAEGPTPTLDRLRRYEERAGEGDVEGAAAVRPDIEARGRLGPRADAGRVPRAALVELEDGVVTNVTFADERTGCLTQRLAQIADRERPDGDGDLSRE